jgi:hypothetical protein
MQRVLINAVHEPVRSASGESDNFVAVPGKGNFMSIRGVAREVYRAMMWVEELERTLRNGSLSVAEKAEIAEQLRKARAERDRMQAMLDGAKEK